MFYNLDTKAHYFVPLHPATRFGRLAMLDCSHNSLVECELKPYTFNDFDYKIIVTPVSNKMRENFCDENFYTADFISMVESGNIVKKTSPTMHVEVITGIQPIGGAAYIVHSAEMIMM